VHLAGRPGWLLGIAADVGGYALQFYALAHGSLVLVQPLLVSGLLFALPLSAALGPTRVRGPEWAGAAAVVVGLSVFLVVAGPGRGGHPASDAAWVAVGAATLAPTALVVAAAELLGPGPSVRRAALLSVGSGLVYGLAAALTKATAELLARGVGVLVRSWQPLALVAVGALGLLLSQSAFQAGPLRASLPVLTVVDPVTSILVGALAFGEPIAVAGADPVLEAVGLGAMAVGVFLLGRSPVVAAELAAPDAAGGPAGSRAGGRGLARAGRAAMTTEAFDRRRVAAGVFVRELGEGPPVLFVHGQPGRSGDWDAVLRALGGGVRAIVPDRPGWGRSPGPALGIRANAEVLAAVLEKRGAGRAVVVGHSFGAAVAVALALQRPEQVAALVLAAPAVAASSLSRLDRLLALPVAGETLARLGLGLLRLTARSAAVLPDGWRSGLSPVLAGLPDWVRGAAWRAFVVEQRALLDELPGLERELPGVAVPAVVLAGRRDRVVPPRAAEAVAAALGSSEMVWVEAGHLLPFEAAATVAAAVRSAVRMAD
jgi:pimeloyl-ACP methyl ester carboxylesterase/drug/metabolite transporter (DMT)-like permease